MTELEPVDISPLVSLVERLSERVAELERENFEAITLGHLACNERDAMARTLTQATAALARSNADVRRLQDSLTSIIDAISQAAASTLPIVSRARLRAILAT